LDCPGKQWLFSKKKELSVRKRREAQIIHKLHQKKNTTKKKWLGRGGAQKKRLVIEGHPA